MNLFNHDIQSTELYTPQILTLDQSRKILVSSNLDLLSVDETDNTSLDLQEEKNNSKNKEMYY